MVRGDCNNDGMNDIADPIYLLAFLFPQPGSPTMLNCEDACDGNDDSMLDIADPVAILASLFGSPAIPLPEPYPNCGVDPTLDGLDCSLENPCP